MTQEGLYDQPCQAAAPSPFVLSDKAETALGPLWNLLSWVHHGASALGVVTVDPNGTNKLVFLLSPLPPLHCTRCYFGN